MIDSDFDFLEKQDASSYFNDMHASNPKCFNLIKVALSMGACIAGSASLFAFLKARGNRNHTPFSDIDVWFPNEETLSAFLGTVLMDRELKIKKSFTGSAIDVKPMDWGSYREGCLQVIVFKVGNPKKIISEFDFSNVSVAMVSNGFHFHKDVERLFNDKHLQMQNDGSPFFVSRVRKYIRKGFRVLDPKIQVRLHREMVAALDKAIENHKDFDSKAPITDDVVEAHFGKSRADSKAAISMVNSFDFGKPPNENILSPDMLKEIKHKLECLAEIDSSIINASFAYRVEKGDYVDHRATVPSTGFGIDVFDDLLAPTPKLRVPKRST